MTDERIKKIDGILNDLFIDLAEEQQQKEDAYQELTGQNNRERVKAYLDGAEDMIARINNCMRTGRLNI